MFTGFNKVGGVILPLSLSVTRGTGTGIRDGGTGDGGGSNGNKGHKERTPYNKDTNKKSMSTPIQKA